MPAQIEPDRAVRNAAVGATTAASGSYGLDGEQIRQIVLQHCQCADDELSVDGPVATSEFSTVFHGVGTAFATPVAIKLFFEQQFDETASDAARGYYAGLVELREIAAGDPDLGVVEPLGLIEDHDIVITEWLAGPTLARAIITSSPGEAVQTVRKAGAWLARLQEATLAERKPIDADALLRRLQRSMDANPRIAGGRTVQHAVGLLRRMAGRLDEEAVIWCRSHGDLKPRNLILCDGQVFGIDLDLLHQTPCVHDAAHFLNHLQLLFLSPTRLHRLRTVPVLMEAFRQGFDETGQTALPALPLAWEMLRNAVHLLVRHREWTSPPRSWGTSLPLRRLVHQLSRDLASDRFDKYN